MSRRGQGDDPLALPAGCRPATIASFISAVRDVLLDRRPRQVGFRRIPGPRKRISRAWRGCLPFSRLQKQFYSQSTLAMARASRECADSPAPSPPSRGAAGTRLGATTRARA
jgi:hypothetical protein